MHRAVPMRHLALIRSLQIVLRNQNPLTKQNIDYDLMKPLYSLRESIALDQRRSEDYTGIQRGQARFFTYYRFLALRRHCSVGFRCVYTSSFREIQKRFIEKKLLNGEFLHYAWKQSHELLFCLFTVCQNSL